MTSVRPVVLDQLDRNFFLVRADRLTPRERDYLPAMAELGPGPHRSGDIASMLGVKVESVAPRRSQLIAKGMIFSPAHGDTAFTVPLFDDYLRRVSQPWGLAGGEPGAVGENWLLPGGYERLAKRVPDKCTLRLKAGDDLRMLTPGGGGWGPTPSES